MRGRATGLYLFSEWRGIHLGSMLKHKKLGKGCVRRGCALASAADDVWWNYAETGMTQC